MTVYVLMTACLVGSLLLLLLVAILLLVRAAQTANRQQQQLAMLLMQENQSLRNQLRSGDVVTLHAMNQATLPQQQDPASNVDPGLMGLSEALLEEQQIAREGYSVGGLSGDLAASGWTPPVTGVGDDGTPVVFER